MQVEVPPPKSLDQRISILKVHTHSMNDAGRLLVNDPPTGTAAERYLEVRTFSSVAIYHDHPSPNLIYNQTYPASGLPSYNDLLEDVAKKCKGYSGAALAGVARAAASHALERAVNEVSAPTNGASASIMDCLVTREDFYDAVEDVLTSLDNSDHAEEDEEIETTESVNDGSNDSHNRLSPE